MADAIYHFVWGTFCDWYVELVKGAFDEETKRVAAWAFDQILVMLHPLMPFVTEELWNANERPYELIVAKWPEPEAQPIAQAKAEIDWLVAARQRSPLRADRTERSAVRQAAPVRGRMRSDATADRARSAVRDSCSGWPGWSRSSFRAFDGAGAAQVVVDEATFALPLEGVIDLDAERGRLSKGAAAAEKERDSLAQRLANPNFTERAKPEAVEKARADHEAKAAEAERLRAALERLG